MNSLAQTGTRDLLEQLSDYIEDVWINHLLPRRCGVGRPSAFSSAQLFRVSLLALLTPARSFNLLVKLLPENRAWRRFARLPNRFQVPDAKMLHAFRDRLSLIALRQINGHLLRPLLEQLDSSRKTVAIMDSTDLAASALKKTNRAGLHAARPWGFEPPNPAPAAGLSATRSTRCGYGCPSGRRRYGWYP